MCTYNQKKIKKIHIDMLPVTAISCFSMDIETNIKACSFTFYVILNKDLMLKYCQKIMKHTCS